MKKQTAVEWLIKEIKNFDSGRSEYYSKVAIYNHAFRMEKEQIINAFINYFYNEDMPLNDKRSLYRIAKQYYNETYN
jgi:hypothetical protein